MRDERAAGPHERHLPLPLVGLGGALLINGGAALLAAVFHGSLPTLFGFAPVLGCFLALAGLAGVLRIAEVRRTALSLALLGIAGAALTAGSAARYLALRAALSGAPEVRDLPVTEAPRHPEARLLFFREAKLLPGCLGKHLEEQRDHHHAYYALPIVPPGWRPADPVPAWAGFTVGDTLGDKSFREHMEELKRPHQGGLAWRNSYTVSRLRQAMIDASGRCGLTMAAGAPLLEWMSPAAELGARARAAGAALALLNGLWLLRLLLLWRAQTR